MPLHSQPGLQRPKGEAMCWTLLQDERIPLTNNQVEQAIQPYVQWHKTSFVTQSAQDDPFHLIIPTIVSTTQRLDVASMSVMREICNQEEEAHQAITVRFLFQSQTERK